MNFQIKFKHYALLFIAGCVVFLIVHITHLLFIKIDVILFSTLFDVMATLFLFFCLSYFYLTKNRYNPSLTNLISATGHLGALLLIYAILVPTVIDRSLTLFILNRINQSKDSISSVRLHKDINKFYFIEMNVLPQRLIEQQKIGTLARTPAGDIKLTPFGTFILRITNGYKNLLINNSNLTKSNTN